MSSREVKYLWITNTRNQVCSKRATSVALLGYKLKTYHEFEGTIKGPKNVRTPELRAKEGRALGLQDRTSSVGALALYPSSPFI